MPDAILKASLLFIRNVDDIYLKVQREMEPIYILSLLLLFSADRGQILKIFQR